jgi:hypothetical protein
MGESHWEPGTQYNLGDKVKYEGHRYKIIQPHRSQSDWTPDITPALWGRIADDDHDGGHQQHQHQQHHDQSHHQSQQKPQQPPAYGYGNEKPQQDARPTKEEQKKNWYDLDDHRKKQLELGGGLLAGAAAIGAGYFAFKEHEKNEEEKKAQTWALQNWLQEATERTRQFNEKGPRGPATWILNEGKHIPQAAILGGEEKSWKLYICRAFHDGGILLGKASDVMKLGAVIGYCNEEIHLPKYEILIGDMNGLRWVQASGRLNVQSLGARPVEGGRENDGTPLYIAQAYHHDATHPGKASEKLDGAYIPYDGKEKKVESYRVLCYA